MKWNEDERTMLGEGHRSFPRLIYLSEIFHGKSLPVNDKFFRFRIACIKFFQIPSIGAVV